MNVVNSTNQLTAKLDTSIASTLLPTPFTTTTTTTTTTTAASTAGSEELELVPKTLWIDLPNMFPWRHCLQEYNSILTVLACNKVGAADEVTIIDNDNISLKDFNTQKFLLESTNSSELTAKPGILLIDFSTPLCRITIIPGMVPSCTWYVTLFQV